MGGFEPGEWEEREKDWAVYKQLDQFSVNWRLLRAEEEKAVILDEMEGVILTTLECAKNYDVHCLPSIHAVFHSIFFFN